MKQEKEMKVVNETKEDITFDVRSSTVFYEQWYQIIKDLPPKEKEKAFKYIFEYAFYGIEPNKDKTTSMSYVVFGMAKPNIDSAQKRYDAATENGQKGGRPKKVTEEVREKIIKLRKNGMTQKDVAIELGLSLKTIQRVEKDISQNHNYNVNDNVNDNDDDDDKSVASKEVNTEMASPQTESSTPAPSTPTELTYEQEVSIIKEFKKRKKPYEIAQNLSLDIDLVDSAIDGYVERGYKFPPKPTENKQLDITLTNGKMHSRTKAELFNDATDNGKSLVEDVAWTSLENSYIMMDIPPFTAKQLIKDFQQKLKDLNDMAILERAAK